MGHIASIERRTRRSALVILGDGRELVLDVVATGGGHPTHDETVGAAQPVVVTRLEAREADDVTGALGEIRLILGRRGRRDRNCGRRRNGS